MYVLVSRTRTDILSTLIRSLRSDLNRTGQNLFTRFINRSCEMFPSNNKNNPRDASDMHITFGLAVDTKLVWAGINGGER